jgi:hypothetical protein
LHTAHDTIEIRREQLPGLGAVHDATSIIPP